MCCCHRGDYRNMWPHQPGQRCDFTRLAHADLEDRKICICGHAGQAERHPPVIVVTGHRRMRAALSGKDGSQHFFGRGFANRPRDRNNPGARSRPRRAAQRLKRVLHILNDQQRCLWSQPLGLTRHQRRSSTVFQCLCNKIMAITFGLKRYKQIPRLQTPGVD